MKKTMLLSFFLLFILLGQVSAVRKVGTTYTSKTDMINQWKALCNAHPTDCSYVSIGNSYLGSNIYIFKIGSTTGGKIMFDGSMHGWEDAGTEIEYKFAKWVLESSDTRARNILKGNRLYFIPIVNMDNRVFRQNSRVEKDGSVRKAAPYGVDLNRNFVTGFGTTGSGNIYNNFDYRGPYAASEPETRAVRKAMADYRPKIYLNTHMGGGKVYSSVNLGTLDSDIIARYNANIKDMGLSYKYPIGRAASQGYSWADAKSFGATSAWYTEMISDYEIPDTLSQMLAKYYPPNFAMFLAMCESIQVK